MRRLEEEREAEERRRRQIESKKLYETNLRLKMKKKAREEQEQLAFDMKVLETLLQETANEAAEMAQRKVSERLPPGLANHINDIVIIAFGALL